MPVRDVENLIAEASCIPGLQSIAITGGEPFLFRRELMQIIASAGRSGLWTEVVTNSFWAKSYELAHDVLRDLKNRGLRNFVTSIDSEHAEFVAPELPRNAVLAGINLGLQVTVKSLKHRGSRWSPESIQKFLSAGAPENLKLVEIDAVPVGRAAEYKGSLQTDFGAPVDEFAGRCQTVIRYPAVDPDGDVYACCGFGEGCRFIGSVPQERLRDILRQAQNNLLLNLLACCGPSGVWDAAACYMTSPIRRCFTGACDLCNALYQDSSVRLAVAAMLSKMSHAVQHMGRP